MPGGAGAIAAAAKKKEAKKAAEAGGDDLPARGPRKTVQKKSVEVAIELQDYKGCSRWRMYQKPAEELYNNFYLQVTVAGLIGFNFLVNIVQAQISPAGDKYVDEFGHFDLFFNLAFLFELVLNMYATWFCKFWKSGWNIFDFLVVVIGWMFQLNVPLPGPMKLLRMMRAFRVFRLFKRVKSLNKIMTSLAKAIPGVMNAFLIQLIVMCIYAIIAVDRFQDYGEGGFFTNEVGTEIELSTGRGQDYGFEYFGDFGKSLYTMFQVLTGESWSEVIARPLFHSNNPTTSMGAAFFFVTFVILNAVVLINVVVAVLLEKMVDDPNEGKEDEEEGQEGEEADEEEEQEIVSADPVQENVDVTLREVSQLKEQLQELTRANADMQRQLAEVDSIKECLSQLLQHSGIQVTPRCHTGLPADGASPSPPICSSSPNGHYDAFPPDSKNSKSTAESTEVPSSPDGRPPSMGEAASPERPQDFPVPGFYGSDAGEAP